MTTPTSPYVGEPTEKWPEITKRLLAKHPLTLEVIREVALTVWEQLWATTIGSGATAIRLADLNVPATVVGYFFEVLFARELHHRSPEEWRGNESAHEKDLVYLKDPAVGPGLSVEIKTSGQLGHRVYGNRSFGQKGQGEELGKKEKSGYYITANFSGRVLTLLRFGWIDEGDWRPQTSQRGQMAGLPDEVYTHKLAEIPGEYRLNAPIDLLNGVGPKTAEKLRALGIRTIRELLDFPGQLSDKGQQKVRSAAMQKYRPAGESSPK